MEPDEILRDVFAEHAEARPDAAEALAAVRLRINRQRRIAVTRTTAVLGAVAAVAAVAVTGTALAGRADPHPGTLPAGGPGTSAPPTVAGTPAPPSAAPSTAAPPTSAPPTAAPPTILPTSTAPAPPPPPRSLPSPTDPSSTSDEPPPVRQSSVYDYSTIAAGWLPGPGRQVEADNQPGFEERDYDVDVDGTDMDVIIYTESGTSLPTRTEAGVGDHDFTINGHPAREFVSDVATIVAMDLGNGTIAYAGPSVVATTDQVTTARITGIAEHVAREMQFDRHDPIPAN